MRQRDTLPPGGAKGEWIRLMRDLEEWTEGDPHPWWRLPKRVHRWYLTQGLGHDERWDLMRILRFNGFIWTSIRWIINLYEFLYHGGPRDGTMNDLDYNERDEEGRAGQANQDRFWGTYRGAWLWDMAIQKPVRLLDGVVALNDVDRMERGRFVREHEFWPGGMYGDPERGGVRPGDDPAQARNIPGHQ